MSLGRQCLQCKKRRVKCGSEEPQCSKCAKDGYICPGYTKPLHWVQVHPRRKKSTNGDTEEERSLPRDLAALPQHTIPKASSGHHQLVLQTKAHSPSYNLPGADRRTRYFARAVEFFNTDIIPDMSAMYWQTKQNINARAWLQRPKMLQNMLIVSALMTRSIRAGKDLPELYKYRGQVIQDLTLYLQRPAEQTPAVSLASLVGILQQEIHLSPKSGFSMHLDAARRVVESCGGVRKCLEISPASFQMIFMFVQADIMSATTTHAKHLTPHRTKAQYGYIAAFDDLETQSLDSPLPCPPPLLRSIIRINNLRPRSQVTNNISSLVWRDEYLDIIECIQKFDALIWSRNLAFLPETTYDADYSSSTAAKEWASLASCYQAATTIYLIESARSQDLMKESHVAEISLTSAVCAHQQLRRSLLRLFDAYPCRTSTVKQPTLWRFVQWPLMVYAYEMTMLSRGYQADGLLLGAKSGTPSLYKELREIGTIMASHAVLSGADILENVPRVDGSLTWDSAFAQNLVFYL